LIHLAPPAHTPAARDRGSASPTPITQLDHATIKIADRTHWQFTTDNARIKLKRLYPQLKEE
jgi:hypothetical protein